MYIFSCSSLPWGGVEYYEMLILKFLFLWLFIENSGDKELHLLVKNQRFSWIESSALMNRCDRVHFIRGLGECFFMRTGQKNIIMMPKISVGIKTQELWICDIFYVCLFVFYIEMISGITQEINAFRNLVA